MTKIDETVRIWIMPTDTIVGIHARAFDKEAIDRIYKLKGRKKSKKMITLFSSFAQLKKFGISLTKRQREFLQKIWPGPVSVIIENQAFRMPDDAELLKLISRIGPIVSTSANLSGNKHAKSTEEAKKIFGDKVDLYINGKSKSKEPSIAIEVKRW